MKPFPPGEKKRATKKNKRATKPGEPYPRPNDSDSHSPTASKADSVENRDTERALIGSLVDSYGFKEGGLVKKTMSVNVHGVHHHLVSYYKIEDARDGTLAPPSKDPRLANTEPRADLIARQNFRAPLDDMDDGLQYQMNGSPNAPYGYNNGYRPNVIMNPSGHPSQSGQMGMSMYPGLPYSSATHMQPGIQSYAPISSSQSYYPPTSGVTHPVMPKQEDYGTYNPSYHSSQSNTSIMPHERSVTQSQSNQSAYGYRQSSSSSLMPRANGMLDAPNPSLELKPLVDNPSWNRGPAGGVYSSTSIPTSNPSPSYPGTSSQWNPIPPGSQALPHPENRWMGGENSGSQWGMQNSILPRHNSYHATSQSN